MSKLTSYQEGDIIDTIKPYASYEPTTYPDVHLVFTIICSNNINLQDDDKCTIFPRFYLVYKKFDPSKLKDYYNILYVSSNLSAQLNTNFAFDGLIECLQKAFPEEHLEYLISRLIEIKKPLLPKFLQTVKDYFTNLEQELKEEDEKDLSEPKLQDLQDEVRKLREELNELKEIILKRLPEPKEIVNQKSPEYVEGDIIEEFKPHSLKEPENVPGSYLIFTFLLSEWSKRQYDEANPDDKCILSPTIFSFYKSFDPSKLPNEYQLVYKSINLSSRLKPKQLFDDILNYLNSTFPQERFPIIGRVMPVKKSLFPTLFKAVDDYFNNY